MLPLRSNLAVTSSSAASVKSLKFKKSILHIQRAWRAVLNHKPIRKHALTLMQHGVGIAEADLKSISCQQLIARTRSVDLNFSMKSVLERIAEACRLRHAAGGKISDSAMVLGVFLIAYKPADVFDSEPLDVVKQSLFNSAVSFAARLQLILTCLATSRTFDSVPHDLTDGFLAMMAEFTRCFLAWKIPDKEKMTRRLQNSLDALYNARASLPSDEPENSPINVQLKEQIRDLRGKLKQIAGSNILHQFDVSRPAPHVSSEIFNRAAPASNEQIAQELLLNPAFAFNEYGGIVDNYIEAGIRQSFYRVFWDALAVDLSLEPPCFVRVLRMLLDIRDGLCEVSDAGMRVVIGQTIDFPFIQAQISAGLYGWESCNRLIVAVVDIIKQVQGPSLVADTQAKWTVVQRSLEQAVDSNRNVLLSQALEFLSGRISALRIDEANKRIRRMAPIIRDHGIGFLRNKFQQKLACGTITLMTTKIWISTVMQRETAAGNIALDRLVSGNALAFASLHLTGMFYLVVNFSPSHPAQGMPATLFLDVHRISMLYYQLERIVNGVTLLVLADARMGGDRRPSQEKRSVLTELATLFTSDDPSLGLNFGSVADKLRQMLDSAGLLIDEGVRTAFLSTLEAGFTDTNNRVRILMTSRVHAAWIDHMRTRTPIDAARFISFARPLIPFIENAAVILSNLAAVNRAVHAPIYNRLIADAAAEIGAA